MLQCLQRVEVKSPAAIYKLVSVLLCVAVCCCVLLCAAVCCSMLQCAAVC